MSAHNLCRLMLSPLPVITLLMLAGLCPLRAATLNVPSAAYRDIQTGMHAAHNGDTVLVANGTYTGFGNTDLDFGGKNITVRSAHGAAATTIDCGGSEYSPHRAFLLSDGATVDGFTIRNGYAPGVGSSTTGYNASGGGIYSTGGGTVTGCVITDCTAEGHVFYIGSGFGGGIYFRDSGTVTNCVITHCTARGYSGYGGGLYGGQGGSVTVTGCTITDNAASFGGGLYLGNGTADYPIVTNCVIAGNTATASSSDGSGGGGLFYDGYGTTFVSGCTITGNTVTGNFAGVGRYGGGFGRGIAARIDFTDCILWGNHGGDTAQPDGLVRQTNCDSDELDGIARINADPLFVDPAARDYRLRADSPCLGAGTTIGAPLTDVNGSTRPNPPSIGAYEYAPRPLFWTAAALSVGPDGVSHLLWGENTGEAALWRLGAGGGYLDQQHFGPFPQWTVRSVATGPDGFTHVLAVNTTGEAALWRLDAQNRYVDERHYGPFSIIYATNLVWKAGAMSVGPDNVVHLVWTSPSGMTAIWRLDAQNRYLDQQQYGPFSDDRTGVDWTLASLSTGPDNVTRAAWTFPSSEVAIWRLDAQNRYMDEVHYGTFRDWTLRSLSTGPGNITRLVWTGPGGEAAFWRLDAQNRYLDQRHFGPFPGWSVQGLAAAPDGGARALWVNITGEIALWRLDGGNGYRDAQHYGLY